MRRSFLTILVAFAAAGILPGQDEPPQDQGDGRGGRGGFAVTGSNAIPDPQPYERVITKDAKTTKGLFTVHQIRERYYYEIPKSELGKEMLWNSQIAKTTLGVGYGGGQYADRVVRWDLKGNRVLLMDVNYGLVANPNDPIAMAVRSANNDSIIRAFPVAAFSKDGAPVIEVARMFVSDPTEFSARQRLGATGVDGTRTFLEHIHAFPDNLETEVTVTYTRSSNATTTTGGGRGPGGGLGGGQMRPGSATVVLHHSMVRLPEKPMQPRLFDERVGYFTTSTMDYSRNEYKSERTRYIARWRLEKKDPNLAVSEPVKPIVYYIDAATPKKWVPWLKKGIEDWNEAFLAAGFKNAIIGKEAPSSEQDPAWSPEDVRHSVIRWLPSTVENASGPHISDPRTGEILNADIQFYHNVMNLARDWYFVQVGPLDPRAQKLPLPDELMGRLLEYVTAHEVGHTLGFQHNMKASSMYPFEKVRDKEWVHKMGHTPSIMDYSRFNYVAQPEDGIAPEDLIPRIGPYDVWATKWGYSPIPGKGSDEEKAMLDKWAREQDNTPWYRFSTANSAGSDPGEETEAVGDADAVKATALGVKNLQRVTKMLMSATAWKEGETYNQLSELYGRMLSQWSTEMSHVAGIVGGFNSQEKVIGQEGRIFTLIPKEKQQEAVRYLVDSAFTTPSWMIDEEILRRIEPVGVIDRIRTAQNRVLVTLMNSARYARLAEQEALDGNRAYSPVEFLATVRKGIWRELDGPQVKIDPYRRELQRSYLHEINTKLNGTERAGGPPVRQQDGEPVQLRVTSSGDEKPMYRTELKTLSATISAALAKTTDHETKAHLEASRDEIAKILDPKFIPPAPAVTTGGGRGGVR